MVQLAKQDGAHFHLLRFPVQRLAGRRGGAHRKPHHCCKKTGNDNGSADQEIDEQPLRQVAIFPGRNRSYDRSEEHTSELQSLMRISYAVFCLKKKNHTKKTNNNKT